MYSRPISTLTVANGLLWLLLGFANTFARLPLNRNIILNSYALSHHQRYGQIYFWSPRLVCTCAHISHTWPLFIAFKFLILCLCLCSVRYEISIIIFRNWLCGHVPQWFSFVNGQWFLIWVGFETVFFFSIDTSTKFIQIRHSQ